MNEKTNKNLISYIEVITRNSNWIALVIILNLMMVLITLDVFLRYLFNAPLAWGREANSMMLVAVIFLSLAHCWVEGGHIRMDLLYEKMKPPWKALSDFLSAGIGLFFWGVMCYRSYLDVFQSIELNEIGIETSLPLWPVRIILCFGLIVFCLQLLISIIKTSKEIFYYFKGEKQ